MKRNPQVIMKNPSTLKNIFLNFVEFSLTAAAPGFVLSRQGAAGSQRSSAEEGCCESSVLSNSLTFSLLLLCSEVLAGEGTCWDGIGADQP